MAPSMFDLKMVPRVEMDPRTTMSFIVWSGERAVTQSES